MTGAVQQEGGPLHLTQKVVDGVALERDSIYWNDDVSGLGRRVQARRRTWVVRYRVAGAQRQRTLAPGDLPLRKARELAAEVVALARRGKDLVEQNRAAAEPQTEACPEVLLLSFLTAFGSAVGRGPYFRVEDDQHGPNLFVSVVGNTSKGRKGTSWRRIRKVFAAADPPWTANRVVGGLRSGEALIDAVRDARIKTNEKGESEILDEGVADKRLLVVEEELASMLRLMQREARALSP